MHTAPATPLTRADIKDVCALTSMQQGMLHHALLSGDTTAPAYHEQLVACFDGELDLARLTEAWQRVLDRHDALRGLFLYDRVTRPAHAITHRQPVHIAVWQAQAGLAQEATLKACLAADRARPFDLCAEHAMRWQAWHETPTRHWLVWSFHHILLDGWSIGLVLDEVLHAYRQLTRGEPVLPDPAPPYARYQRWLAARDAQAASAYWRATLDGCEPARFIATLSGAASKANAPATASASLQLNPTQLDRLMSIAASERTTLSHVLTAAWALLTGRYQDRDDVLVGTVLAGRPADVDGMERMAGVFIATVPLRVRWRGDTTYAQLLRDVRDTTLAAAPHAHLPLPEIQACAGGATLLDTLLLVQALPFEDVLGPVTDTLQLARVDFHEDTPFALELSATPTRAGLDLHWKARAAGLDNATLQGVAASMAALLDAIAAQPQAPLAELDCLSSDERAQLAAWSDGGTSPAPHTTIPALFAHQLQARPDAPALLADGQCLSYRELDARANRIAHALLALLPQPGVTRYVAVVAERGVDLVAGLLGILKAGAAYVPVDPDFPSERVTLMLEDSGCAAVLVSASLRERLALPAGVAVLAFDEVTNDLPATDPGRAVAPDDAAYLIYTSGSTGTPKGARLRQRNAASFFAALPQAFGFAPGQRILALTTVSFDIAGLELLGALCCGMTVVMASAPEGRDPARLLARMSETGVEVVQITPTRLRLLLEAGGLAALAPLRTLLVGGEALPPDLARELATLSDTAVFNVYGPTETTIWSAYHRLDLHHGDDVALGRPLPGERIHILSAQQRLQPLGAIGEIAIAGDGVGDGYHNRAELSAERFRLLPEIDAAPLYLSGDLGRWRADGRLEYFGRTDDQIKVRGMRIEPSEIEHRLRAIAGVRDALVVARAQADGDTELIAYLATDLTPDPAAWRTALAEHLPDPLLPARFVTLAALPQTPNGKIDRRALPDPEPLQPASLNPAREPANPREAAIVAAFASVLGVGVGPDDDFFEHGGHSLRAMQAIGRINRELKSRCALRDLYTARNAAQLARLAGLDSADNAPIAPAMEQPDYPLSAAQTAMWVLEQQYPDYTGYNVPGAYRVRGAFDADAFRNAWAAVTQRHEALRTVFTAPHGEPRQRIRDELAAQWLVEDLRDQPASAVAARVATLCVQRFDLERGPLVRLAWLRTGDDEGLLVLVEHHMISDGWSDQILARDLASAYRAALQHLPAALPTPPTCRYRDYASWQQQHLAGPPAATQRDAWRQRLLHPAPAPLLQLPVDGARSQGLERPCARMPLALDATAGHAWHQRIGAERRTVVLASALFALLHVESGQSDIVIGLPVAGRDRAELQDQVGLHLNLLPLRLRFDPQQSLQALMRGCDAVYTDALARADYPFARLAQDLGLSAPAGRHPVFDALLIFHQHPMPTLELDGAQVTPEPVPPPSARFDLDVELWAHDDQLSGFIDYDAGLFSSERAETFATRLCAILDACARRPELTLAALRTELTSSSAASESAAFVAQSLALDEEF
jgi:amino acid adenylation domain-containing protein